MKYDLLNQEQNPLPDGYLPAPKTPRVKILDSYNKTKLYDGLPIENPTLDELDIKGSTEDIQLDFEWYTANENGEWLEKLPSAPTEAGTYNLIVKAGVPNAEGRFPSVIWGQDNIEGIVINPADAAS